MCLCESGWTSVREASHVDIRNIQPDCLPDTQSLMCDSLFTQPFEGSESMS